MAEMCVSLLTSCEVVLEFGWLKFGLEFYGVVCQEVWLAVCIE